MKNQTAMVCASHSPLLHCYDSEPRDFGKLQEAFRSTRQFIEDFDPQLVIAFGSDHFNGFFLNLMPAFCIGTAATATADIGGYPGELDVPSDVAIAAVESARQDGVDVSVSYQMTVDHAFSQTIHEMLGALTNKPVIPVFINCITPPYVPFHRTRMLGEVLGRFAVGLDRRVLFLGSGGMSHHPTRYYPEPGQGEPRVAAWQLTGGTSPESFTRAEWLERLDIMHHEGAKMITRGERTAKHMRLNEASDREFLDHLVTGDLEAFDSWDAPTLIERGGIGSMELHAWIAAASAHRACGGKDPQLDIYTHAPELGIAAGIVHAA